MMGFKNMFEFLDELAENNHKGWMDANRDRYNEVKTFFTGWLIRLSTELKEINPSFRSDVSNPKIFRINSNRRFNPRLPVYKDHFASELDSADNTTFFYLHFGVKESFIAGGLYLPDKESLDKIRQAIDYNGEVLKTMLNKRSFQEKFGALADEDVLKRVPRGYPKNHPHDELLKLKSFVVAYYPKREECYQKDFLNKTINLYREMIPFRVYLDQALSLES